MPPKAHVNKIQAQMHQLGLTLTREPVADSSISTISAKQTTAHDALISLACYRRQATAVKQEIARIAQLRPIFMRSAPYKELQSRAQAQLRDARSNAHESRECYRAAVRAIGELRGARYTVRNAQGGVRAYETLREALRGSIERARGAVQAERKERRKLITNEISTWRRYHTAPTVAILPPVEVRGDVVEPYSDEIRSYRSRTGVVHAQEGDILAEYNRKITRKVFESKTPWDNREFIAVEIECISKLDRQALGTALLELAKYVCVKGDGSIRAEGDYTHTHEIVVMAPKDEFSHVVRRVCAVLAETCAVNKSCGLHVHFDQRQQGERGREGPRNVLVRAKKIQQSLKYLFDMLPQSRKTNTYCVPNKRLPNESAVRFGTGERYRAINLTAYRKHSTLEMRCHSGTIDAEKIQAWVDIVACCMTAEPRRCAPRTVGAWKKWAKLSPSLSAYYDARVKRFNDINTQEAA